jgi:hypothetical protein
MSGPEGNAIPAEAGMHVVGADAPKSLPHGPGPSLPGPQPHVGSLPNLPEPSGGRTQEFERGQGDMQPHGQREEPGGGRPAGAPEEAAASVEGAGAAGAAGAGEGIAAEAALLL